MTDAEILNKFVEDNDPATLRAERDRLRALVTELERQQTSSMNGDVSGAVIGYMCRIDFECELGAALGGNTIYPDIEDCREKRGCTDHCGMVEVEVRCRRIVHRGDGT